MILLAFERKMVYDNLSTQEIDTHERENIVFI